MSGQKIIVYIATSADGHIARRDGGVKWLDRPRSGRLWHERGIRSRVAAKCL